MRHTPLAITVSFALAVAACGNTPAAIKEEAAQETLSEERVVNVYSARHYDSDRIMFDAFTEQTGIKVQVRQGDTTQLLETMKAEGVSSPADLVIAADAGSLWLFGEAGLLANIDPAALPATANALSDSKNRFVSLSSRFRVIVVNAERVALGDIANYSDLADPRWQGEICVRSSTNIYNLSLLADLIDRWGPETAEAWAAGVKNNMARAPQGGDTDQIRAVAAGECAIALVNQYYWVRLANSQSDSDRAVATATRVVFPDQALEGAHRNITGVSLSANAPNSEEALALVEFLLSTEGQSFLVKETGEVPMDPKAERLGGLDGLDTIVVRDVDLGVFGANQAEARMIFDRVGWN